MKKVTYMIVAIMAIIFTSCVGSELDESVDRQIERQALMVQSSSHGITSTFEVISETMAVAGITDALTGEVLFQQALYRQAITIDLGSKETSAYGEWSVVDGSINVSVPETIDTRAGNDGFIITSHRVTVNSTISNGEVEFNPNYTLEYESCTWSNGDTTIVFDTRWDVNAETVMVNAEGRVSDELTTNFCESYVQKVNEFGTLSIPSVPDAPTTVESRFKSVQFSVTLNPSQANAWLVGCAVTFTDGTWALALEQDGTPVASRSNFWAGDVNTSYNGAYYIESRGAWYPAISSDHNNGMEWCVSGKKINIISYAEADAYANWGNGNRNTYGQHSVKLTGYSVKDNPQSQTLTFFFDGVEKGSLSYAEL